MYENQLLLSFHRKMPKTDSGCYVHVQLESHSEIELLPLKCFIYFAKFEIRFHHFHIPFTKYFFLILQYELLFCIEDKFDPAIKVVETLMQKYPTIDSKLFIGMKAFLMRYDFERTFYVKNSFQSSHFLCRRIECGC